VLQIPGAAAAFRPPAPVATATQGAGPVPPAVRIGSPGSAPSAGSSGPSAVSPNLQHHEVRPFKRRGLSLDEGAQTRLGAKTTPNAALVTGLYRSASISAAPAPAGHPQKLAVQPAEGHVPIGSRNGAAIQDSDCQRDTSQMQPPHPRTMQPRADQPQQRQTATTINTHTGAPRGHQAATAHLARGLAWPGMDFLAEADGMDVADLLEGFSADLDTLGADASNTAGAVDSATAPTVPAATAAFF